MTTVCRKGGKDLPMNKVRGKIRIGSRRDVFRGVYLFSVTSPR